MGEYRGEARGEHFLKRLHSGGGPERSDTEGAGIPPTGGSARIVCFNVLAEQWFVTAVD